MKNAILKPTIHRAGSATIALLSLAFAATAHAKKPNIVFVFSDDHATQAISAYGGRLAAVAPTPNLDRIAENGMRFNRCMVGNSICGPSRATVLTGKHSHMNGFMRNETDTFDGSQQTFPKLLRKAGYQPPSSANGIWKATQPGSITGKSCPARESTTNPSSRPRPEPTRNRAT